MYKLSFWFEHGGECLWAINDQTKKIYGYPIEPSKLPLSKKTLKKIANLKERYSTYLNWNDPAASSEWTYSEKIIFLEESNRLYDDIVADLGEDYTVVNKVNLSIDLE